MKGLCDASRSAISGKTEKALAAIRTGKGEMSYLQSGTWFYGLVFQVQNKDLVKEKGYATFNGNKIKACDNIKGLFYFQNGLALSLSKG